MKKVCAIVLTIAGLLAVGFEIHTKIKESAAISIIGGADGPTAIFLAGKVNHDFSIAAIIVGIVLVLIALLLVFFTKHRR